MSNGAQVQKVKEAEVPLVTKHLEIVPIPVEHARKTHEQTSKINIQMAQQVAELITAKLSPNSVPYLKALQSAQV